MNAFQSQIQSEILNICNLKLTDFVEEQESKEYHACKFSIASKKVFYRVSKITPKKVGQFVTFYQRNDKGIIAPFFEDEPVDYFMVHLRYKETGVFVFPKEELIKRGILSTKKKEGKRAFRVYPPWDKVISKQALATQKWQSNYFYDFSNDLDITSFCEIFQ